MMGKIFAVALWEATISREPAEPPLPPVAMHNHGTSKRNRRQTGKRTSLEFWKLAIFAETDIVQLAG